jgi:hypothetical protein
MCVNEKRIANRPRIQQVLSSTGTGSSRPASGHVLALPLPCRPSPTHPNNAELKHPFGSIKNPIVGTSICRALDQRCAYTRPLTQPFGRASTRHIQHVAYEIGPQLENMFWDHVGTGSSLTVLANSTATNKSQNVSGTMLLIVAKTLAIHGYVRLGNMLELVAATTAAQLRIGRGGGGSYLRSFNCVGIGIATCIRT